MPGHGSLDKIAMATFVYHCLKRKNELAGETQKAVDLTEYKN